MDSRREKIRLIRELLCPEGEPLPVVYFIQKSVDTFVDQSGNYFSAKQCNEVKARKKFIIVPASLRSQQSKQGG